MDDVRKVTFTTLAVFVLGILSWIGFLYVSACGFTTSCRKGSVLAVSARTPIPTLVPATLPAAAPAIFEGASETCMVEASDLLAAWVNAGYPEAAPFDFTDENGTACTGTFGADVSRLMTQNDLWYPGALACTDCHGPDLESSAAQLDLSSYGGILAGDGRTSQEAQGSDILAAGDWSTSDLNLTLAAGHPPGAPANGSLILAGVSKQGASFSPTFTPNP
jgi:hypothetical protein